MINFTILIYHKTGLENKIIKRAKRISSQKNNRRV